jgi:hypothetical protein
MIKAHIRAGQMGQVEEHLCNKFRALSSTTSTEKKKKAKQINKQFCHQISKFGHPQIDCLKIECDRVASKEMKNY